MIEKLPEIPGYRIVPINRKQAAPGLSSRERQIAEAYANGATYREIAESLFIAPATVRTHLSAIYRKLSVSSKLELLRKIGPAVDSPRTADGRDSPPPRDELHMPAMAVLPMRVLPDVPRLKLVGAGLTEDLTILLARVPGFIVASRDCARTIDPEQTDANRAGALLRARYLVAGSIMGSTGRLRITIELNDAWSETTLWAGRFDTVENEDILDLQTKVSREVTRRLEPELARAEFTRVERRPLENLDAWELYHRAQGLLVLKGLARDSVRQAFDLLHRAVEIDPDFALAHAQLAAVYAWCNVLSIDLGVSDFGNKAMASLDRALELDRRNPTVLGFAGCALFDLRQHQRGLDILRQAVELDPSNAIAQAGLGAGLLSVREYEEGTERLREGIRLSPLDERTAFWGTLLARALYRNGKLDEAADEARQACRRSDTVVAPRVMLSLIELERSNTDAAEDAMNQARRIEPALEAGQVRPIAGRRGIELMRKAGLID